MDEILYLEPDEEITSVIDKMRQSPAARLSLVVPREATLLQSVVNLRLLSKEAGLLGKEIALVTTDRIGRNLAAKVGLKVYETIRSERPDFIPPAPAPENREIIEINDSPPSADLETKPAGVEVHHFQEFAPALKTKTFASPQTQPTKIPKKFDFSKYGKVFWALGGLVGVIILAGAYWVLPKTEVRLKVKAENYSKDLTAQISGEAKSSEIEKAVFAGKLIDLRKDKEEKFPTTGKKNLGGKASGTITIYNNWDNNSHNFSAGTKLSSSSKTFVLKNNVTVPGAGRQSGQDVPGTINADIEAENAGEEYNVQAGRFTIVGLAADSQKFIYGQSTAALTGGFTKVSQVVAQSDYDQAKDKLTKELTEQINQELKEKAAGLEIIESAIQIDAEETSSAKVDEEAQDFSLKITLHLREIVYNKQEFDKFIISILEKQIPAEKMLSLSPNDVIVPKLTEKKYDQNLLALNVNVSAKISSRVDSQKIKANLLGKNQVEARKYLLTVDGLSGEDFLFSPGLWPIKRIPNYARSVSVTLQYLEPTTKTSPSPTPTPEASL